MPEGLRISARCHALLFERRNKNILIGTVLEEAMLKLQVGDVHNDGAKVHDGIGQKWTVGVARSAQCEWPQVHRGTGQKITMGMARIGWCWPAVHNSIEPESTIGSATRTRWDGPNTLDGIGKKGRGRTRTCNH